MIVGGVGVGAGLVSSSADVPCMKSLLASHRDSRGKDECEGALDCKMQVTRSPVKKDAHIQVENLNAASLSCSDHHVVLFFCHYDDLFGMIC